MLFVISIVPFLSAVAIAFLYESGCWMAVVRGRARSCAVRSCAVVCGRPCVVGHVWSCVLVRGRARSCVVVRAWSVMCGRARSVMRGRARSCAVVRAWSVMRGRSCVVVPFCPLRGQHCRDTNERRKERTTYNNPLNPPGVGWVNFFYPIKVRISMGTCVPNFGAIRRPVRKKILSNL